MVILQYHGIYQWTMLTYIFWTW